MSSVGRTDLIARVRRIATAPLREEGRTRHVHALQRCREHLLRAQQHAALQDGALDLLAEELRLAHRALGEITGQFSSEDLLGEIFSRFCIGK